MALTQVQKPSGFVGVNGRLMIVLTSDNVSEPKFRFKVSLYKDVSTLISTAYVDPDPNDFGVFDCSPRLQSLVSPQIHDGNLPATRVNIFDLPADKAFVDVVGAHEEITVVIDESYAATAADNPADQSINDTFAFTIYAGSTLITDGINVNTNYGVMLSTASPCLIDVTQVDEFGFPNINIGNDDRFCLAWFNANENSVPIVKWRLVVTFEGGSTGTDDIAVAANTVGNGDGTTLYFMCGAKDLSDCTLVTAANRPSAATTWVSYTVQPFDASTAIGGAYTFIRDDRGCRYDSYQLCFTNKHGAWNFQTFHMLSQKTIESTNSKSYLTQVGNTDDAVSYAFDSYARERTAYGQTSTVKLELNTNWLSREEAIDMESVIYSRDVRMILNGSNNPIPVIVTNRSHRLDKYKKLRQYKITVEVAQRHYQI